MGREFLNATVHINDTIEVSLEVYMLGRHKTYLEPHPSHNWVPYIIPYPRFQFSTLWQRSSCSAVKKNGKMVLTGRTRSKHCG